MPSRKQRRRREKGRRHEYEYVYVDAEGHEVAVDEPDGAPARKEARTPAPKREDGRPTRKPAAQQARPGGREIQPPSWSRVGRRALIFAPIMFVTIWVLDRGVGVGGQLLITAQMLLLFIPFSYLMDRMMYRRHLRQTGRSPEAVPRRGRPRA